MASTTSTTPPTHEEILSRELDVIIIQLHAMGAFADLPEADPNDKGAGESFQDGQGVSMFRGQKNVRMSMFLDQIAERGYRCIRAYRYKKEDNDVNCLAFKRGLGDGEGIEIPEATRKRLEEMTFKNIMNVFLNPRRSAEGRPYRMDVILLAAGRKNSTEPSSELVFEGKSYALRASASVAAATPAKPAPAPKRESDPSTVDGALAAGWAIKSETGRQVILAKEGRVITRYRSNR